MILSIIIYGSRILKTRAEEIEPGTDIKELIQNMFDTLDTRASGIGLAAPQIGQGMRLFIVSIPGEKEEDRIKRVFINPEILEYSEEKCWSKEGCISVPEIYEDVERPRLVKVKFLDENYVEHEEWFTGILSRVIQHEYDHLEGKTFIDRLSNLRRTLIKNKLNMLKSKIVKKINKSRLNFYSLIFIILYRGWDSNPYGRNDQRSLNPP